MEVYREGGISVLIRVRDSGPNGASSLPQSCPLSFCPTEPGGGLVTLSSVTHLMRGVPRRIHLRLCLLGPNVHEDLTIHSGAPLKPLRRAAVDEEVLRFCFTADCEYAFQTGGDQRLLLSDGLLH